MTNLSSALSGSSSCHHGRALPACRSTTRRRAAFAALLLGDPEGDPVEPVGQQLAIAERRRLLDEDEERGLERILRRVLVTQDPATRSQDQRTVTVDQDS